MGEITKSKIAEHSWDEDHRTQWDKTEILHKGESRTTVLFKTEWLNSEPGIDVITTWLPLLQDAL
jgi:hypothetical protein